MFFVVLVWFVCFFGLIQDNGWEVLIKSCSVLFLFLFFFKELWLFSVTVKEMLRSMYHRDQKMPKHWRSIRRIYVFLSKMMFFLALSQKERLSLCKKMERMCSSVLLSQNSYITLGPNACLVV